jgi:3-deoxy-7-phosphoheptulonate synthase
MVSPMARAAVAAGADGVMLDVHDRPEEALCDGPQAISPAELARLTNRLAAIAEVSR